MKTVGFLSAALLVAGCTSDQTMRIDGVTPGAGDSIAANTVLQMVDPWQRGVEDTRLSTPAASASAATPAAAASAPASGGSTASTSTN